MAFYSNSYTTMATTIGSPTPSYTTGGTSGYTSSYATGTLNSTTKYSILVDGDLKLSSTSKIQTPDRSVTLDQLLENIEKINEVLSIIMPDKNLLAQNPTLKDAWDTYHSAKEIEPQYNSKEYRQAYEHYRLLEAMLKETKNGHK